MRGTRAQRQDLVSYMIGYLRRLVGILQRVRASGLHGSFLIASVLVSSWRMASTPFP